MRSAREVGPDLHPELPLDPDTARRSLPVHLHPSAIALVVVGGAVGTAVRYGVTTAAPAEPGTWPWATTGVNLVGAFVLGVVLEALTRSGADRGWRRRVRLLLGTGFCGGLTTYSTLALEVERALAGGRLVLAAGYPLATIVAGLVTCWLGITVAARHHERRAGQGAES